MVLVLKRRSTFFIFKKECHAAFYGQVYISIDE